MCIRVSPYPPPPLLGGELGGGELGGELGGGVVSPASSTGSLYVVMLSVICCDSLSVINCPIDLKVGLSALALEITLPDLKLS